MPYKPNRPCSYPGCPKLTDGRFCEEHQKQENKRYEKYDRSPEMKKRYGRAWKRIRDRHIMQYPLCEMCKKHGRLTPAEEVHHIVSLSQGGTHDDSNLMSLCKACHSKITAKEGGRWTSKHRDRGGRNLCEPIIEERAQPFVRKKAKSNTGINPRRNEVNQTWQRTVQTEAAQEWVPAENQRRLPIS